MPSYVEWAEERQKREASRGRPNRSAELQSKGPEDFTYHKDDCHQEVSVSHDQPVDVPNHIEIEENQNKYASPSLPCPPRCILLTIGQYRGRKPKEKVTSMNLNLDTIPEPAARTRLSPKRPRRSSNWFGWAEEPPKQPP